MSYTPIRRPDNVVERYEMVMGSSRDGMFLELWDRQPRELPLWAFYCDADGSFEFMKYRTDVPADVEAWFEQEARGRLPPSTAKPAPA